VEYSEQRRHRRAKISKPLRVRPSEPRDEHFEEQLVSVNASRGGIYFTTRRATYYAGMRLFITFPFGSSHDQMNCEYVARVVRVEPLPKDRFGIAVELLMTMNMQEAAGRTTGESFT
jgi:PilZ domain-containing protein